MDHLVTVTGEKLVYGGSCLTRLPSGKSLFVPKLLPGETAEVNVTQEKKSYAFGAVAQRIEPSSSQIEPLCPHFFICGGCAVQRMTYESELACKERLIEEQLLPLCLTEKTLRPIVPTAEKRFRSKTRVHQAESGAYGYAQEKSSSIFPLKSCPVLTKALEDRARSLAGAEQEVSLFDNSQRIFEGEETAELSFLSHRWRFSASAFFQSNLIGVRALVEREILELEGVRFFDFYSGVGLFSSFLALRFDKGYGFEGSNLAVSYAKENLKGEDAQFFALHDTQWGSELDRLHFGPADCAVLDPPRGGASAHFLEKLVKARPSHVLYISCSLPSLVRDLKVLQSGAATIERITPYDFYPHSMHCEIACHISFKRA